MPWRGYVGPVDAKGQDGEDEINIARLIAETIKRGLEWMPGCWTDSGIPEAII